MTIQPPPIASKALEANFQQTASTVAISPRYAPLREAVARYQGLSSRLEHLLYEISHPYRNWQLIISEQFFITIFQILKANVRKYPHTSLQCIQVIGGEVFQRGNSPSFCLVKKILLPAAAYLSIIF